MDSFFYFALLDFCRICFNRKTFCGAAAGVIIPFFP